MTTVCMICHKIKSGEGLPVSHGICIPCWMLFYPDTFPPALMAPKAERFDCFRCRHADHDSDGVAESCDLLAGVPCIRDDRRSPWGVR